MRVMRSMPLRTRQSSAKLRVAPKLHTRPANPSNSANSSILILLPNTRPSIIYVGIFRSCRIFPYKKGMQFKPT